MDEIFIILKQNVKTRLVFANERALQKECFLFVTDNDDIEIEQNIGKPKNELSGVSARKIAADAVTQMTGLADVKDFSALIFHQVAPWGTREIANFLLHGRRKITDRIWGGCRPVNRVDHRLCYNEFWSLCLRLLVRPEFLCLDSDLGKQAWPFSARLLTDAAEVRDEF